MVNALASSAEQLTEDLPEIWSRPCQGRCPARRASRTHFSLPGQSPSSMSRPGQRHPAVVDERTLLALRTSGGLEEWSLGCCHPRRRSRHLRAIQRWLPSPRRKDITLPPPKTTSARLCIAKCLDPKTDNGFLPVVHDWVLQVQMARNNA